jgi:hypothetical protein
MGTLGGGLLVIGLAVAGVAWLLRTLRGLQPDPRTSEQRQAEARRAGSEIQTILVPWMRKVGVAAAIMGVVLILVDLIV